MFESVAQFRYLGTTIINPIFSLENRLTDGGKFVSLTRPLPPRKIPGTHFCQRLSRPQGHNAAGSNQNLIQEEINKRLNSGNA
jgi:hypothetical protein